MVSSFWGNHTCPHEEAAEDPVPFYSDGSFTFKAHHVGWIISGFFALISIVVSAWLILQHLAYFTDRRQQRQVVRILLMVPMYATCSLFSYIFYHEALYFHVIRDCYEAFIIASFFYLLISYLGEDAASQRAVFRRVKLEKWMWPLGSVKARPSSGLYFLQIMKWGILQYVVIRPLTTIAACALNYVGLYCDISYALYYGYIYDLVVVSVSVTIAMYCLLQLAMVVLEDLRPHNPMMKFLCVKSLVFLMFWQSSALSLIFSFGWLKPTTYFSSVDLQTGILALIETFEMCIFAFLHVKAFTYRIYRPEDRSLKTSRWSSFLHVLNHQDLLHEIADGSSYMWGKARGRNPDATRDDDLEVLTGGRRDEGVLQKEAGSKEEKALGGIEGEGHPATLYQNGGQQYARSSAAPRVVHAGGEDRYSPAPVSATRSWRRSSRNMYGLVPTDDDRQPNLGYEIRPIVSTSMQVRHHSDRTSTLPLDLPQLDVPTAPSASSHRFDTQQPLPPWRHSFQSSTLSSDRGTFGRGHRRSIDGSRSPSGSEHLHARHQSTDSFKTAPSSPPPQPPSQDQRLWRQTAASEGVIPFIGIPQGARLGSSTDVVRLRPLPRHPTATSFGPPPDADHLLGRDSRFPRFTPSSSTLFQPTAFAGSSPTLPPSPSFHPYRAPPAPLWHVAHDYDPRFPLERR